jgi:hypothetical protein
MFGNEVTHMTLISNNDVCENTFRPVLTHMTLLWNKDVCENKVESGIDPYDLIMEQGRL